MDGRKMSRRGALMAVSILPAIFGCGESSSPSKGTCVSDQSCAPALEANPCKVYRTTCDASLSVTTCSPMTSAPDGTGCGPTSTCQNGLCTPGAFSATGSMAEARTIHTATLLRSGKVLVVGGWIPHLATAELYDSTVGTFSATGSMSVTRDSFTATVLANGKVLITGGVDPFQVPRASAEVYDPSTGQFSPAGSMGEARALHAAVLLPNGMVLITGGLSIDDRVLASAERYDPVAQTFSPVGSMSAMRMWATATLLPSGEVLVAGGSGGDPSKPIPIRALSSAELFDPTTSSFTRTGSMGFPRVGHTATLLADGGVLVAGGSTDVEGASAVEAFDPSSGSFSIRGAMAGQRNNHSATLLLDGRVLFAGGLWYGRGDLATAETFDPVSRLCSPTGSLSAARYSHTAVRLPNGQVLVAGGSSQVSNAASLTTAEVFTP